ncbi:MAG: hypothetical protein HZA12_07165 [Nitrospirae bacterium]|nr:hypothetical protein [Nitrospirota bacterium]
MKIIRYLLIFFLSLFNIITAVYAQDLTFHGFLQGNVSARVTGEETPDTGEGGDFLSGEERIRGEITGSAESSAFVLKIDLVHDSIGDEDKIDIREGYIDYRSDIYDIRIGRQIITWGTGDLLFINDTYPKNYSAFFSGQPLEYLKIGSDAAKVSVYSDALSAELVIIPFFEAWTLPDAKRFFLYAPMEVTGVEEPREEIENSEIALRLYRQTGRFDTSLYLYRGFFKLPGMRPESSTTAVLFYPQLAVYGFSLQGAFADGVLSMEGGYYDSIDDRNGDDPAISNSATKYIIGYSRQMWTDFTAGVQLYGEYMQDYGRYENSFPAGFPKTDRLHQLITLRLMQMLKYNTLRLSLFTFYSPDDEDYFIIPEARYNITDSLWTTAGMNLFGGKDARTFFGQLDKNDNIYATIRYEF